MEDSYGIFTTDGETISGSLHDDYAVNLAERLDESTASLYINTKNGVLLLGTAVNVQKAGRRPDTFIYLEKTDIEKELPPRIDLLYIHEFYKRVKNRLSKIEYEIRNLASDDSFFDERNKRITSSLSGSNVADYAIGRLLLSKETVCVSDDLSKSVDFVVAVTEKLSSYISAGFTIVVSKRTFRGADLLVTEKFSGDVQIYLDTEKINDKKRAVIYKNIGVFAQNPKIRQKISGAYTKNSLTEELVSQIKLKEGTNTKKSGELEEFLREENIKFSRENTDSFSPENYESRPASKKAAVNEAGYSDWKINDYDRENLMLEYEKHMEKKHKGRVKIIALLAVVLLLAAGVVFFSGYTGFFGSNDKETDIPHITPSATIVPEPSQGAVVERLNSTPGNMPEGFLGFGSAYMITVSEPSEASFDVTSQFLPDKEYFLMIYNQSGYSWEPADTSPLVSNESATAYIEKSGIYRLFIKREN